MSTLLVSEFPPWALRIFAVLFGLVWGSFLNVVIHRVPRGESIVRPASRCGACGTPIRAWNNIPILSWLLLRGKASCCRAPISYRYPLVEGIGGVLSLAIVEAIILHLPADTSLVRALVIYIADLALVLGLTSAAFIDLEHMYIPHTLSVGASVLGLATFSLRPPLGWLEPICAAATAFLLVWLVFGALYRRIRGRTGMGLGDATLLMVAGAWFGWPGLVFTLLAGSVQGSIVATAMLIFRGRIEDPEFAQRERDELLSHLKTIEDPKEREQLEEELKHDPLFEENVHGVAGERIAFGPFIVLAIIEYLLVGQLILDHYFQ